MQSGFAKLVRIMAFIISFLAIIGAIFLSNEKVVGFYGDISTEFNASLFFIYFIAIIIQFIVLYGFSEIIELIAQIEMNTDRTNSKLDELSININKVNSKSNEGQNN